MSRREDRMIAAVGQAFADSLRVLTEPGPSSELVELVEETHELGAGVTLRIAMKRIAPMTWAGVGTLYTPAGEHTVTAVSSVAAKVRSMLVRKARRKLPSS